MQNHILPSKYNVIHVPIRLQPICWRHKKKSRNAACVAIIRCYFRYYIGVDDIERWDWTKQNQLLKSADIIKGDIIYEDEKTVEQRTNRKKKIKRRKISKYLNWTGIGINVLFYFIFFLCLILTNSHSFGLYSNHRGHLIIRSVIIMYLKLTYATHIDNNIQNCLWLHA